MELLEEAKGQISTLTTTMATAEAEAGSIQQTMGSQLESLKSSVDELESARAAKANEVEALTQQVSLFIKI